MILEIFLFCLYSKSCLLENGFLNYLEIVLLNSTKHKITSLKMLIYSAVNESHFQRKITWKCNDYFEQRSFSLARYLNLIYHNFLRLSLRYKIQVTIELILSIMKDRIKMLTKDKKTYYCTKYIYKIVQKQSEKWFHNYCWYFSCYCK